MIHAMTTRISSFLAFPHYVRLWQRSVAVEYRIERRYDRVDRERVHDKAVQLSEIKSWVFKQGVYCVSIGP